MNKSVTITLLAVMAASMVICPALAADAPSVSDKKNVMPVAVDNGKNAAVVKGKEVILGLIGRPVVQPPAIDAKGIKISINTADFPDEINVYVSEFGLNKGSIVITGKYSTEPGIMVRYTLDKAKASIKLETSIDNGGTWMGATNATKKGYSVALAEPLVVLEAAINATKVSNPNLSQRLRVVKYEMTYFSRRYP